MLGKIIAEGESITILGNEDARKFCLGTRLNINGELVGLEPTASSATTLSLMSYNPNYYSSIFSGLSSPMSKSSTSSES